MLSLHQTIRARRREQGFTLVEVMVGMVIAMLGIIIMMQMYATFEGQKRTTTGGDDAQNAGAIALYGMQQNIQQAGYCFSATPLTIQTGANLKIATGTRLLPVMIDVIPLAPSAVSDTNTNTLVVTYGNDACAPESASGVANAANTVNVLAYAVKDGNLMQCNYAANDCSDSTKWELIAGDVVSLRAECNLGQGVRIALVTRNHQLNKEVVTTDAPGWSGTAAINLTATRTDGTFTWQNYRYKTFETLVPIRNTIWTGGTGC